MKILRAAALDLALIGGSVLVAALLLCIPLALAGFPPFAILGEWLTGSLGTRADLLATLKGACPLILTGLAAGVAFRCGVFNIGAEGQSVLGAIAATALATRLWPAAAVPWLAIPAALVAGALGGMLWASIAASLARFRDVPVVLSTILLNFVGLEFLRLLVEGPLKTTGAGVTGVAQSDTLPETYWLPILLYHQGGYVHLGFFIALALAACCWLLQSRTSFGFEMRVTGLNPIAALYAGIPVAGRQLSVLLLSGALAGLAGTVQLLGVEGAHFLNGNPTSYGYAGIAVALLGRLHPLGIVAAAIFFALLDRGAANLEFFQSGTKTFPLEFSDIAKGLIVLVVLAATAWLARRRDAAREA